MMLSTQYRLNKYYDIIHSNEIWQTPDIDTHILWMGKTKAVKKSQKNSDQLENRELGSLHLQAGALCPWSH